MESHIYRIIKNKLTIIIFTIIILIPCVDISLLLMTNTEYHPAYAFFLSGTSVGHASQMIDPIGQGRAWNRIMDFSGVANY